MDEKEVNEALEKEEENKSVSDIIFLLKIFSYDLKDVNFNILVLRYLVILLIAMIAAALFFLCKFHY